MITMFRGAGPIQALGACRLFEILTVQGPLILEFGFSVNMFVSQFSFFLQSLSYLCMF